VEDGLSIFVGKGKMADGNRDIFFLFGHCCGRRFHFFFGEEIADPLAACDGGLDILDFHADAFQWREDFPDVGDQGDGGARAHAEECLEVAPADGEDDHDGDDKRAHRDDDRRVNRVIQVAPVHRVEPRADGFPVLFFHEGFAVVEADRADAGNRFRDGLIDARDGFPVVELRGKHAALECPREEEENRQ